MGVSTVKLVIRCDIRWGAAIRLYGSHDSFECMSLSLCYKFLKCKKKIILYFYVCVCVCILGKYLYKTIFFLVRFSQYEKKEEESKYTCYKYQHSIKMQKSIHK